MTVPEAAILLAGVATVAGTSAGSSHLVSLADGIAPLAARFNHQPGRAQIVAILSPT